jgi:predicted DNA-binding protein with PD1-like motif
MKSRLLHDRGQKVFAVVFDKGEEVVAALTEFARRADLGASHFTVIGAFSDAVLGYFDRERRDYRRLPVREQVEVLVLAGNITVEGDAPKVHAHAVLGRADGSTVGGHLLEAHVWPTLEAVVEESPAHLVRRPDPETGLTLLALDDPEVRAAPRSGAA